jgi:hypothetical protein
MCQRPGLLELFCLLSEPGSTFSRQDQSVIHGHPRQSNDVKVDCHALKLPQSLLYVVDIIRERIVPPQAPLVMGKLEGFHIFTDSITFRAIITNRLPAGTISGG